MTETAGLSQASGAQEAGQAPDKQVSGSAPDEPSITIGGRTQLVHLLAEASEIEHTLMCSYLYAAFSLRTGDASGLEGAEAQAVTRWRDMILSVATEEMVHLLLVANLSIAIGGRPHLGRPNFPVEPGYFPAEVVVKLTRFSPETLDHFIFLERPQGYDLPDGDGFEPEADYVREEAFRGLTPSIQDYSTVGRLYEALRANLEAATERLGEAALFIGPVGAQVGRLSIDLVGVDTIANLTEALRAIDTIVEQGEGSTADREDSHYQRFQAIRDEYAALLAANPDFEPAWPVVDSPVMRRPPDPADKTFVDHPVAARLLDLANAVYAMLLQLIVQAFGRTGPDAVARQGRSLSAAIALMHVLSRVAGALVRCPATLGDPGLHAGVSFTSLRSVEPLFAGAVEEQLILERLDELVQGARSATRFDANLGGVAAAIEQAAVDYRTPAAEPDPGTSAHG